MWIVDRLISIDYATWGFGRSLVFFWQPPPQTHTRMSEAYFEGVLIVGAAVRAG